MSPAPRLAGDTAATVAAGGDRFAACLAFVLAREGGWSNDPRDPGGATMKGVTLATFRGFFHEEEASAEELRAITDAQLATLYAVGFWQPLRCQDLPAGLDLLVMDHGVNAGVRRSAVLLQQAVGVAADGWIGPATLAAVGKRPVLALITDLAQRQEAYYRGLKTFPTFGRGWLSRLAQRKSTALSAARGGAGLPITAEA